MIARFVHRSVARLGRATAIAAGVLTMLLVSAGTRAAAAGAQIVPAVTMPASATPSPTAGVVMDTTIRPGLVDFSRYTTPGRCLSAARRVAYHAARVSTRFANVRPRTPDEEDRQTPPADAIALAARRCDQSYPVESTPPEELLSLMQLALLGNDDAAAKAAADRWLQLKARDTAMARRGWHLLDVMMVYFQATPRRLAAAESLAARIDALGPEADHPRWIVHRQLLKRAMARLDVAQMEREALTLVKIQQRYEQASYAVHGGTPSSTDFVYGPRSADLSRSPKVF